MRISFAILTIIILSSSCKPRQVEVSNLIGNDSVKFTYIYSEALKNRMLGQTTLACQQFEECLVMNPLSTASAYQLAQLAIEAGDLDKAKNYSEICITNKPENEWFLLQRADIAKRLNEKVVYSKVYTKLAELFPDNLNYLYEYSIIQYEDKQYNDALVSLQKLEEEIGINENISFLRNNIYFSLKRMDAIQLELLRLSKAFPDSTRYSDMLADFYLSYNQPEKALNVYQAVLDIENENGFANLGVAWINGSLGKFKQGFPYLIKGIKSPLVKYESKKKVVELYLNSKASQISDDSIEAIYLALLDTDNPETDVLNRYISYLFDRKDYAQAEKFAQSSITVNPDNFTAWDVMLNILMIQGRNEKLKEYSLKALEYFPNHALVFFFSGYSQFALKQYNEAINYFEMGLDYVGDNENLDKQFLIYLGESYHYIAKHKQSDSYFDKYLKIDSSNAFVLNNYAFYLVSRNTNLDKALALSYKSIEIEPFNSTFLDTYAWILFNLNDVEKAKNYIERAYKYGGNSNSLIVEHFGDILFKKNKIDEALERWKEAYALNRSNSKLLEKINKIELEN